LYYTFEQLFLRLVAGALVAAAVEVVVVIIVELLSSPSSPKKYNLQKLLAGLP
jgi:hypothetical protein